MQMVIFVKIEALGRHPHEANACFALIVASGPTTQFMISSSIISLCFCILKQTALVFSSFSLFSPINFNFALIMVVIEFISWGEIRHFSQDFHFKYSADGSEMA